MNKKLLFSSFLVIPFLLLAFTCNVFAEPDKETNEQKEAIYKKLELFSNILSIIQENYVEEIDPDKVMDGAIDGMLSSLDPHSSYLTPEEFQDLQDETEGSFTGIGIEVTIKDGKLTVISPIEGTPAYKAGIKVNDVIVKIDNKATNQMDPMVAIQKLRGDKGTKVQLSIQRKGETTTRDYILIRDTIPVDSVHAFMMDDHVAYTRITNFQSSTTDEFTTVIDTLNKKNKIEAIILDLRNNPGGLLDQAVSVSDLFLNSGLIVYTKGRSQDQNMVFNAKESTTLYKMPLIIIVNEGTASAAEIVSGAIQDHKRGLILGTQTFGKGSVQSVIPFSDGGGLRLTTARYYTPLGRSIQARGIRPDIMVRQTDTEQDSASKQITREKDLTNHMENDTDESVAQKKGNTMTSTAQLRVAKDTQLRMAYDIIKGSVYLNTPNGSTSNTEKTAEPPGPPKK